MSLISYANSQERIWKTRVLHTFPLLTTAETVATSVQRLITVFPHTVSHVLAQSLISGSESVTMDPLHTGRTELLLFTNYKRKSQGVIH